MLVIVAFHARHFKLFSSVCLFHYETRSQISCDGLNANRDLQVLCSLGWIDLWSRLSTRITSPASLRSCSLARWKRLIASFYRNTSLAACSSIVLVFFDLVTLIAWFLSSHLAILTRYYCLIWLTTRHDLVRLSWVWVKFWNWSLLLLGLDLFFWPIEIILCKFILRENRDIAFNSSLRSLARRRVSASCPFCICID